MELHLVKGWVRNGCLGFVLGHSSVKSSLRAEKREKLSWRNRFVRTICWRKKMTNVDLMTKKS